MIRRAGLARLDSLPLLCLCIEQEGHDDDVDAVELERLSMLTWHGCGSHLQCLLCSEHTQSGFLSLPWLGCLELFPSELQRPAFLPSNRYIGGLSAIFRTWGR